MTKAPAARTFEVRHVQIARAAIAAIAAVMVTFSPDHSAAVGLSIFSGFAFLNALVLLVASKAVYPAGRRWPAVVLGVLFAVAGLASSVAQLRSIIMFFVIVIAWALTTGLIETIAGARGLRAARREQTADPTRSESRDALTIGILTLVLGLVLLLVPTQYALRVHDRGRERDVHAHRDHHRRRDLRRLHGDRRGLPRDRGILAPQAASGHDRGAG